MVITAFNPETDDLEVSHLSSAASDGATSLSIDNNDRFATDNRILIGEMGTEKAEIVTVTAVSGNTTLTTGATKFDHDIGTPVYKLRFDQAEFYRSTTGIDGTYSSLSTQALDVDNESLETSYDDTTGLTTYFYKVRFSHSISLLTSAYGDAIGGGGWRRRQIGYIIDQFLQEVGDPQENIVTRAEILGWANDVNDELEMDQSKPYNFLKTRTAYTRTINRNYLDFPTNSDGEQIMWKFDRMDYEFQDNTTDPVTDTNKTITVVDDAWFRNRYPNNVVDSTTVSDKKPDAMTLDEATKKFYFSHPAKTTAAAVFYLYYWKHFDRIDTEGDEIETPTGKIYKLYFKAMFYRKRSIAEPAYLQQADRWSADYIAEKGKYKPNNRKDRGTPRGFRPPSDVTRRFRR